MKSFENKLIEIERRINDWQNAIGECPSFYYKGYCNGQKEALERVLLDIKDLQRAYDVLHGEDNHVSESIVRPILSTDRAAI